MKLNVIKKRTRSKMPLVLCVILTCIIAAACQADNHNEDNHSAMPQAPIAVTFSTDPESVISAGDTVILIAEVTQEGQPVDDAERVRFEIWIEDEEDESGIAHHDHPMMDNYNFEHEMIDAEFYADGQYVLDYTFQKAGTYYVMYHVDARGFHAMTANEVVVE